MSAEPTRVATDGGKKRKCQMACKPGSVPVVKREMAIPLGRALPQRLTRPTRTATRKTRYVPSLFGLAPGGACRAGPVAGTAVRSYRTISTLPEL